MRTVWLIFAVGFVIVIGLYVVVSAVIYWRDVRRDR